MSRPDESGGSCTGHLIDAVEAVRAHLPSIGNRSRGKSVDPRTQGLGTHRIAAIWPYRERSTRSRWSSRISFWNRTSTAARGRWPAAARRRLETGNRASEYQPAGSRLAPILWHRHPSPSAWQSLIPSCTPPGAHNISNADGSMLIMPSRIN